MELKRYQRTALAVLRRYLELACLVGPDEAYEQITNEPEQAERLLGLKGRYVPLTGLPAVPYVCLRLPTGGGKTLLAAHAIRIAGDAWVEKERPMVLWLVPSSIIREQTVSALKDTRHPYRRALDERFDGRVRVFNATDFADITPQDLETCCCVVVATIQTFRANNTEGRRVYAHSEHLEPHFSRIGTAPLVTLERLPDGGPKFSFANLMHLHRPVMIVDEAHNALTALTREMQVRVNPSIIIELTATPRPGSNLLHSVRALELKDEHMIKFPIMLSESPSWQNAVANAVARRAALAELAATEPDYIRPITLYQAQSKEQEVTVEVLKRHLIETERVPEKRIAVATGDQRELDGIDLFDPDCPIEHVITVEALREGWDCSFAYVFCSVARVGSAINVEQLLGRVLRMPYARRRRDDMLNCAYASLSEARFGVAAKALTDSLIRMGFDKNEAAAAIKPEPRQDGLDDDQGGFELRSRSDPLFRYPVGRNEAEKVGLSARPDARVETSDNGTTDVVASGAISEDLAKAIASALPASGLADFESALRDHRAASDPPARRDPPVEQSAAFDVPQLRVAVQGHLELADMDALMESHEWSVTDHPALLEKDKFSIVRTEHNYEIYLDGNRLRYRHASENEQLRLAVDVEGQDEQGLVLWLDTKVRALDIARDELLRWLMELVRHLTRKRQLPLAELWQGKYVLERKVRDLLQDIRREERTRVHQASLFGAGARVDVSYDVPVRFETGMYDGTRTYQGTWRPSKHFLGPDHVPAFDGALDGEEFQCAQALDSLAEVRYWVRNVSKHPKSFRLPLAHARFYPDFVASLEDERILIVEYKGAGWVDSLDTDEKRLIGELWERESEGHGLFIIVEKVDKGRDMREQLLGKIEASRR